MANEGRQEEVVETGNAMKGQSNKEVKFKINWVGKRKDGLRSGTRVEATKRSRLVRGRL